MLKGFCKKCEQLVRFGEEKENCQKWEIHDECSEDTHEVEWSLTPNQMKRINLYVEANWKQEEEPYDKYVYSISGVYCGLKTAKLLEENPFLVASILKGASKDA